MTSIGSKEGTLAHDNIYGILGMVDVANLPRALMPNYSQSYERVCKAHSRFIIQDTQNLSLLITTTPFSFGNEPSWAVDFAT